MKTFRILVVDDDKDIRDIYLHILTMAKPTISMMTPALSDNKDGTSGIVDNQVQYEVTMAADGETGVAAVRTAINENRPYSAAFVDFVMPGIDGAQTAKQIWAIDPHIKIVIVTAGSDFTIDEIIEAIGRDDVFYLRKPFNLSEIKQFARAFVVQWSLERERDWLTAQCATVNKQLEHVNQNLQQKVEAQSAQLVQTEKMASIGVLATGLAHEINNPIAFVNANLNVIKKYTIKIVETIKSYDALKELAQKGELEKISVNLDEIDQFRKKQKLDFVLADLVELTDDSLYGIERVRNIINDMKTFSRVDQAELKYIDLNETLDVTLKILRNEYKYKTEIIKEYGDLPDVYCFPQKISQVFLNIIMNAIQAIEKEGEIHISTRHIKKGRRIEDDIVIVTIADTGSGIDKAKLTKIFDPFFTTKPPGQGVGLGLSISYDIVEAHSGRIEVASEVGRGTTFTVTLPLKTVVPAGEDPTRVVESASAMGATQNE
jgi:two-component system, NtrC family, sensor kinase